MAILKSKVFICCCLLFLAHQWMQYGLHLHYSFIDNYLDDLLAMPVLLTLMLAERRWLFEIKTGLSVGEIILATLYVSILTELVFPLLSPRFKGDWLDPVMYAAGAALYYFSIQPAVLQKSA